MYWESGVCGFIYKIQVTCLIFSSFFPSLKKCNLKEAQNQIEEVILDSWDYMAIIFPLTKGKELIFSKLKMWKEWTMEVYILRYNKKSRANQQKNTVWVWHCSRKWGKYQSNIQNIMNSKVTHAIVCVWVTIFEVQHALWMTELLN